MNHLIYMMLVDTSLGETRAAILQFFSGHSFNVTLRVLFLVNHFLNLIDLGNNFFQDDGFGVTAAEPWIKQKIQIIQQYLAAFTTNLVSRVDDITFVDLYAGNGLYSLGARREIFFGSPLMALSQDLPVKRYVYCEKDPQQFKALKIRVNKHFRDKNVIFLEGSPQDLVDKLSLYVPKSRNGYKTAALCLCDPFSLEMPFDTILRLSDQGFNFLVPFTFVLNDQVNFEHYLVDYREKLKRFVGSAADLQRLEQDLEGNSQFYKRLIRIYENNLLAAGMNGSTSVHKLDSGLMEMPVYYIGFFSRQFSTRSIQQDVLAAQHTQFELFA